MKVLWFSNKSIIKDSSSTGSWVYAMYSEFKKRGVDIVNVTYGKNDDFQIKEEAKEWRISQNYTKSSGLPKKKAISRINAIIEQEKPDIIHIWGVEGYWGIVLKEFKVKYPILLEIQGLKHKVAEKYFGGLQTKELLRMVNPIDVIKSRTVFQERYRLKKWGKFEKIIIKEFDYIGYHSDWAKAQLSNLNSKAMLFRNQRLLRNEYYLSTNKWNKNNNSTIFTSLAYPSPFKGLHILVESIAILKKTHKYVKLNIAGDFHVWNYKSTGYVKYIQTMIEKYKLKENINFLGGLNAEQLINEQLNADLVVLPSNCESYGLALAESLMLGIPVISTYNGGYEYVARGCNSIQFVPENDIEYLAFFIERMLTENIVQCNNNIAIVENNSVESIIDKQNKTYETIYSKFYN